MVAHRRFGPLVAVVALVWVALVVRLYQVQIGEQPRALNLHVHKRRRHEGGVAIGGAEGRDPRRGAVIGPDPWVHQATGGAVDLRQQRVAVRWLQGGQGQGRAARGGPEMQRVDPVQGRPGHGELDPKEGGVGHAVQDGDGEPISGGEGEFPPDG